jgi:hypothetical protein
MGTPASRAEAREATRALAFDQGIGRCRTTCLVPVLDAQARDAPELSHVPGDDDALPGQRVGRHPQVVRRGRRAGLLERSSHVGAGHGDPVVERQSCSRATVPEGSRHTCDSVSVSSR